MSFVKLLILIMFATLYREAPLIENSNIPYHVEHRKDIPELAQTFYDVGKEGELVSPEIDPLILTGMSWEESRWRQHGPDGDPRFIKGHYVRMSMGPMQVTKAAPTIVNLLDEKYKEQWVGLTVSKLRDPKVNVQFAYTLLQYYKGKCGGSTAVWIDAYGRGKCPKVINDKPALSWKAKKRCKNINGLVSYFKKNDKSFVVPEEWSCQ